MAIPGFTGHPEDLITAATRIDGYANLHSTHMKDLEGAQAGLATAFVTDVTGKSIQEALTNALTTGNALFTKLSKFAEDMRTGATAVAAQDQAVATN